MAFAYVVHDDRNVLELLDCNYTFLNERLFQALRDWPMSPTCPVSSAMRCDGSLCHRIAREVEFSRKGQCLSSLRSRPALHRSNAAFLSWTMCWHTHATSATGHSNLEIPNASSATGNRRCVRR
jgi:hypothetical protein